ncbi:MAG: DMSO reductase, partial [Sulfuriferula sp.]
MHPAFSVIFFTVSSGAGFGLFALLVLADLLGLGGGLSMEQKLTAGGLALFLVAGGLMSSVFHLANPK